jgi:predicted NACHT family NTPase
MMQLLKKIARFTLNELSYIDYLTKAEFPSRYPLDLIFVEPQVANETGELFSPQQVIQKHLRVAILGSPGSGKTTLLKYYTVTIAHAFLSDVMHAPCPLFFRAYELYSLEKNENLINRFNQIIGDRIGRNNKSLNLLTLFQDNRFILVVDGIDEVNPSLQLHFVNELRHLVHAYPDLKVLVSSRPAGLSAPIFVSGLKRYHLTGQNEAIF